MELVISIVVLGIISGFGYGILVLNAKTFNFVTQHTIARWDARKAMNSLKNELRMMRPQNILGSAALSPQKLFFKDIHGDICRFLYTGNGRLRRQINSGRWDVLAEELQNPPFSYLDINQHKTINKNDLAYIRIDLQVKQKSEIVQLSETVYVRN